MREEWLIWICFFLLVACYSMAKDSNILPTEVGVGGSQAPWTNLHTAVSPAAPPPFPEDLQYMDQLCAPVGCISTKGYKHFAVVFEDHRNTPGRGGLYAMTTKDGSQWDRVVRVYSSNSHATVRELAITCDTNEYIRGRKNGFRNRVYLVWVLASTKEVSTPYSQIFFAVSADGGNTFGVPPLEADVGWQYRPMRLNVGSIPASEPLVSVDEDGEVEVTWTETENGTTRQVRRRSGSGGAAFGPVSPK